MPRMTRLTRSRASSFSFIETRFSPFSTRSILQPSHMVLRLFLLEKNSFPHQSFCTRLTRPCASPLFPRVNRAPVGGAVFKPSTRLLCTRLTRFLGSSFSTLLFFCKHKMWILTRYGSFCTHLTRSRAPSFSPFPHEPFRTRLTRSRESSFFINARSVFWVLPSCRFVPCARAFHGRNP